MNEVWFQLATSTAWSQTAAGARPQAKLEIGAADDPLEREADDAADKVMRMADPGPLGPTSSRVQRTCAACNEEEQERIQTKRDGSAPSAGAVEGSTAAPPSVHQTLRSPGQPLDPAVRSFMELRFGHDFNHVRVHAGSEAATSAASVRAQAYTVGPHIAFAAGKYAPSSPAGRRLLAHELAHVIQQSSTSLGVQRAGGPSTLLQRTPQCAQPSGCPPEFCAEFPTRADAEADRARNRDRLLNGASSVVLDGGRSEVRSLYQDFLDGGSAHRDLSSRLSSYFTRSSTTGQTIRFLDRALEEYFQAHRPDPGSSTTVNIRDAIPTAIAALGTPGDPHVMAFRDYTETPGVLAGGVGVGQVGCPVGAIPSQVEDGRTATGTATGTNSGGSILVSSSVEFTVTDTLDFCPGNCGGSSAQELTIPLSRYEATGISGDVPFSVTFPAPIGAFDSE